jgi:glucokinase
MNVAQRDLYLAVDIGGTKTAVALIAADGRQLVALQEPTCQDGPDRGIRQVIALQTRLLEHHGLTAERVRAIGIGIPAVLDDQDFVLWAPNLRGWRNVDLRGPVEAALGRPVALEYDGHTAVLAEWWLGAGQGSDTFVDVIIGTGIGGGMVLEGRLIRGVNRLAGAAGWFALTTQSDVPSERERALGFWEARAAGPGIARAAQALLAEYPKSSLAGTTSASITAGDVFSAADQGDALARRVLDETAGVLGIGLANIISLVNPELIVLGGGVGSRCATLLPRINRVINHWAQPLSAASCRLEVSQLGPDAGLLGAAYAAMLRFATPGDIPSKKGGASRR